MPTSNKRATNELSLKGITQKLNKEELIKRLTVSYSLVDYCCDRFIRKFGVTATNIFHVLTLHVVL